MTVTAIQPAIAVDPPTSAAAPSRPLPGSVAAPQAAGDTLQVTVPQATVPALIPLAGKDQPADDGVDFTKIFRGFAVGGKIKVGCSIPLAGGNGTMGAIEPHHLKLSGKLSVVGVINDKFDVDLQEQADGTYRMTGSFDLHASVQQQGNRLTVTDLDSPTHKVFFTATAPGKIDVRTTGMGYDKITASIKAK
jgi:hypothetical protein